MERRGFLGLVGGLLVAPAVVKAAGLMPIRFCCPTADWIESQWAQGRVMDGLDLSVYRPLILSRGGEGAGLTNSAIRYRGVATDKPLITIDLTNGYTGVRHNRVGVWQA